jgi:hypothetical protein
MVMPAEEAFRRLTIGEVGLLDAPDERSRLLASGPRDACLTEALLRIGALIAIDAPASSYRSAVASAQRVGARLDDLLAVLVAVADVVGSARVVAAAPKIALAAGYDVEAALE